MTEGSFLYHQEDWLSFITRPNYFALQVTNHLPETQILVNLSIDLRAI